MWIESRIACSSRMRSWGTGTCRARPRPLRCCRGSALPWHPAGRKDSLMKTPRPGRTGRVNTATRQTYEQCKSYENVAARASVSGSEGGHGPPPDRAQQTVEQVHSSYLLRRRRLVGRKALPAINQPRPLMHLVVETHSGVPSSRPKEEISSSTILAPAEPLGSWPFTDRRYAVRVTTGGGSRQTRLGVRSTDLR